MLIQTLLLERFAYLPSGTLGKLILPGGEEFATVELPWKNNKLMQSCIPEGVYLLEYRKSPVVEKITKGVFTGGFEVVGVPDRTYIMLHPGNYPSSVQGCVAVGRALALMKDPKGTCPYGVTNSQEAFKEFMALMPRTGSYEIRVAGKQATYTSGVV